MEKSTTSSEDSRGEIINEAINEIQKLRGLKFVRSLGSGSYGDVLKMVDQKSNREVAMKIVTDENKSENELTIWPKIYHPNIVPVLEIMYLRKLNVNIFLMPIEMKDMIDMLQTDEILKKRSGLILAKKWLFQVLKAVNYLHKSMLVHMDIKGDNVLISKDMNALLCDFTFVNASTKKIPKSKLGLPKAYQSPEACSHSKAKPKSCVDGQAFDLWAFGIMSLEVLTYFRINEEIDETDAWTTDVYPVIYRLMQIKYLQPRMKMAFPASNVTVDDVKQGIQFITMFLHYVPFSRVPADEAMRHRFLGYNQSYEYQGINIWANKISEADLIKMAKNINYGSKKKKIKRKNTALKSKLNKRKAKNDGSYQPAKRMISEGFDTSEYTQEKVNLGDDSFRKSNLKRLIPDDEIEPPPKKKLAVEKNGNITCKNIYGGKGFSICYNAENNPLYVDTPELNGLYVLKKVRKFGETLFSYNFDEVRKMAQNTA